MFALGELLYPSMTSTVLLATGLITLTACGGSQSPAETTLIPVTDLPPTTAVTAEPSGLVDERHTGVLEEGDDLQTTDNSFQDPYTFTAVQGASIEIQLHSTEFDAYLMLAGPSGDKIGESNDDVPGTNDARIQLLAPEDGVYTVFANSYRPGETGAYVLEIRATPPLPDDG